MPEVAYRIGSLIFYMFNEIGAPHHNKHVSVKYGATSAVFDIVTGEKIKGNLPHTEERKVRSILSKEFNRNKLIESWNSLNQSYASTPKKIKFDA
ncbi:MAG: DUF4160 domain-containing protein [Candidatus Protochlamydia sp.]|nr:DUF4160 domain-containing protein [Candidatus Protochlamydia sp.]